MQQSWVNSRKFGGLVNDGGSLLSNPEYPEGAGPSDFTIQQEPFCHRIKELPKFIRVRGGAYFFLPGRRALRYLAGLAPDQR